MEESQLKMLSSEALHTIQTQFNIMNMLALYEKLFYDTIKNYDNK